ncbi:MAG: VWA domain-containing protein [Sphingobacteriales bacterium]|nr:MAG: VWA domain-containing protein [Sphingobacteriales bacterium]
MAQYYIRGEVKDEKNNGLQNVKIILHSTSLPYATGVGGAFGILSSKVSDSLSFYLEGYEPLHVSVNTSKFQSLQMKMQPFTASLQKHTLLSVTADMRLKADKQWVAGDETYNTIIENDVIQAAKYPNTSLVLNVDRASYSNIRRFLNTNSQVPPDAVRIEEMLNYFNFNYDDPPKDSVFKVESSLTSCPWTPGNQLLFLQINTRKLQLDKVPPSNLVFLIDVSGSMDMPNRLPLLKSSFRKLVENLRPIDTVSIVVYGSVVGVMLTPTSGEEKKKIYDAIENLEAGGFTPGEAGILQAYKLAESKFIKGGNNRVILATDGDFNVGQNNEKQLEELITRMKQTGIYLTCLGVGMGNYKDSKIEVLAKKGNGNFAYLDSEQEGEKVLVKELTQTLFSAADDVYMNVEFNPDLVKAYRLIGFDNKRAALADSSSQLEGGEIGSGHSVIALFELTPTEENTQAMGSGTMTKSIAKIKMHYKFPEQSNDRYSYFTCPYNYLEFGEARPILRFAASVSLMGALLRNSEYTRNASWTDLVSITEKSADLTNNLQKEFYDLVLKAQKIYTPLKKKKL